MVKFLSIHSKNLNFIKRYSYKGLTTGQVQDKFIKIYPDFEIKALVEAILVALLPTLRILLLR